MAHGKERSALFRFLYTVLSVITFPIFAVLYVLKHPLWVMFLLLVLCGAAVYYPLQSGVKLEDVPEWYKKKYTEVQYEVVAKVVENGDTAMFSQDMLDDLADEIEANKGLKSENYNAKVSRNKAMDNVASDLKKRSGFKRKGETAAEPAAEGGNVGEQIIENAAAGAGNVAAGGLEALLGKPAETNSEPVQQTGESENDVVEPVAAQLVLPQPEIKAQTAAVPTADSAAEDEFDLF